MRQIVLFLLVPVITLSLCGCVPLIIGGAAGALGAYAVGKDTIQGDTDKLYDSLWYAAYDIAKLYGFIKQEDQARGYIALEKESSKIYIQLFRLTQATTRLKVSARKHHLPDLALAQDLFVRIMDAAR
jgi:hypothetical protein